MPKKQSKPPSYCLHKASGQAVVRFRGRDRYLGKHGSSESYEKYERAIAEWRAGQVSTLEPLALGTPAPGATMSINELLPLRYLSFAESYYTDASGRTTREFLDMKYALKPVRRLFGQTSVASLKLRKGVAPNPLRAVVESHIALRTRRTQVVIFSTSHPNIEPRR